MHIVVLQMLEKLLVQQAFLESIYINGKLDNKTVKVCQPCVEGKCPTKFRSVKVYSNFRISSSTIRLLKKMKSDLMLKEPGALLSLEANYY